MGCALTTLRRLCLDEHPLFPDTTEKYEKLMNRKERRRKSQIERNKYKIKNKEAILKNIQFGEILLTIFS